MTLSIGLFLAFGTLFGLATFSRRHLFSEGPRKPDDEMKGRFKGALFFWMSVCTFLWPIMVVSGLNTAWVLFRRRAHPSKANR